MKQTNKKYLEAGGVITLLSIGFICALMMLPSVTENVGINTIHTANDGKSWHMVVLGDMSPGAGQSGIVNISIIKHGCWNFNSNLTRNTSMFAYCETNNTEMTSTSAGVSNVKYSVRLDVCVKVVWNTTHAFNTTSHVWKAGPAWAWAIGSGANYPNSSWVRGNITMPVFGIQNYSMVPHNITNLVPGATGIKHIYVYYVFNDSASGFWINKSQRIKTCYFRGAAYY